SGIIFKGSGFYETDYKKKSGGGPTKEGAAASAVKADAAKADGAKAAPAAKAPEGGGKKKD
ncbi:MAG TPA: zinc ribbon domain-containing protein, partial [Candidatus Hydrogenedentes bacterium]|nr:zinc ribbon domain-containing protein [Candidatus Hydrogenedentota bacterium]